MHNANMVNPSLLAELTSDPYRIVRGHRDVRRHIRVLVARDFTPTMFVFFPDIGARGIVMLLPQIETINTPDSTVN
jgi:hypothetical protein